jgi:hypothetical protein
MEMVGTGTETHRRGKEGVVDRGAAETLRARTKVGVVGRVAVVTPRMKAEGGVIGREAVGTPRMEIRRGVADRGVMGTRTRPTCGVRKGRGVAVMMTLRMMQKVGMTSKTATEMTVRRLTILMNGKVATKQRAGLRRTPREAVVTALGGRIKMVSVLVIDTIILGVCTLHSVTVGVIWKQYFSNLLFYTRCRP